LFADEFYGEALPTWALFVEIIIAGLIVIFAGSKLTRYADEIADRLGLGAGWIGLILLATVTSLPEVVAGSTSVWIGNADMAFAAIYGSCSFNVTIIVLLNAIIGGGSLLRKAGPIHVLSSSFGIILIGMSLASILLVQMVAPDHRAAMLTEAGTALLITIVYVNCARLVYRFDRSHPLEGVPSTATPGGRAVYGRTVAASLILVAAAWWLTQTGDVLSEHPIEALGRPLGATFVGAMFLALATSLPEIVTSIAAVRIGNLDLALGNIFGSNMFNIFVIPILKVVSVARGDSLLMAGDRFTPNPNLFAGMLAILLTGIAVGGLTYRSQRRDLRRFGFDSVLIGLVYACGMWLLVAA
jgi:cation:H+ antiporter